MTIQDTLASFPTKSALVVGDICLDRWCTYDPAFSEPSRETGISRLGVISTEITPGAGGTVANNLAALGVGNICVLGVCGADGFGYELSTALSLRGISPDLLVRSDLLPTFTYTKLINAETGKEDQPRLDFINTKQLDPDVESRVLRHLHSYAGAFDVIFVADQAETRRGGVVTPAVRNLLAELGRENPEKVIWVDSRIRSELFRNVVLKPNQEEAEAASNGLLGKVDYPRFRSTVNAKLLFVTLGPKGALFVDDAGETVVPTRAVSEPVDICGAGDSFSAGAAITLALTGSALQAARMGNLVASVTIMKRGTGTASPAEVIAAAAEMGW